MSGALIAIMASQAAAARQSILERFRIADATHPERAQSLATLGIVLTSTLDEFIRKGAVREAKPGTFYLDEPTVAALAKGRPQGAVKVLLVILAIIGLVLAGVLVMLNSNQ